MGRTILPGRSVCVICIILKQHTRSSSSLECIGGKRGGGGVKGEGGGGGCTRYHAWPWSYDHRHSHLYNAETAHVGDSPTRQTLLAPGATRRKVCRESHEG